MTKEKLLLNNIDSLLQRYFELDFDDERKTIKALQDAVDIMQDIKEYLTK